MRAQIVHAGGGVQPNERRFEIRERFASALAMRLSAHRQTQSGASLTPLIAGLHKGVEDA
jgi:hypothetical protein